MCGRLKKKPDHRDDPRGSVLLGHHQPHWTPRVVVRAAQRWGRQGRHHDQSAAPSLNTHEGLVRHHARLVPHRRRRQPQSSESEASPRGLQEESRARRDCRGRGTGAAAAWRRPRQARALRGSAHTAREPPGAHELGAAPRPPRHTWPGHSEKPRRHCRRSRGGESTESRRKPRRARRGCRTGARRGAFSWARPRTGGTRRRARRARGA
mmetsp:Transcript_20816/g.82996  ORF Transcript_20816/g.82996 Transcript_20816/m.82996 type:complete len:209 (+) Transcript_20816:471-1097(+)